MRLHKTGHPIADTVSDLIGEVPDGEYAIAYGILRHDLFHRTGRYFEVDKGFWGAGHYNGSYRISFNGTQPQYTEDGPREPHGLKLDPMRRREGYTMILPPTEHVCKFFNIDYAAWLMEAVKNAGSMRYIRNKGTSVRDIEWDDISKVITFNSTLGIEAIRRGIQVISDPVHSTVGSFTAQKGPIDYHSREELLSFCASHQFKLDEKEKICSLIRHYLCSSAGTQEKQSSAM